MNRARWAAPALAIAALLAHAAAPTAASSAGTVLEAKIRSTAFTGVEPITVAGALPSPESLVLAGVRRVSGIQPQARAGARAGEWIVTALDGDGGEIARSFVSDPHVVRSEQPGATGTLQGRVLYRPSAEVVVTLPDDVSIRSLRIDRAGDPASPLGRVAFDGAIAEEAPAAAFPVTTIVSSGNPANRVDFAVVAEGYTASEMSKFANDARAFFEGFMAQEPYREYGLYFNVHRIDVPSNQSGADHPERQEYRDTAFDATYLCAGTQRLICVNNAKVFTAVNDSLPAGSRDHIVVIVNDPEYGGSGGAVAVSSTHEEGVELVLHETGHSFGGLGDEYGDPWITCNPAFEPSAPNVTREVRREQIKWNHWIDAGTQVPTLVGMQNGVPGLYSGAAYCPAGLWRPTIDSKMRSLGRPFEQINMEQLLLRTYSTVSPIDASAPAGDSVSLGAGGSQTFSVVPTTPRTHALDVAWTLDGSPFGTGPSVTVLRSQLSPGSHTLVAAVTDPTTFVRRDPLGLLRKTRTWTVIAL